MDRPDRRGETQIMATNSTPFPPLSVRLLGGSGKTGRRVADRLAAAGHQPQAVSGSSEPRFDWSDPETHARALAGADAAYLAYYPDISFPGAAEEVRAVVEVAARQDVRRVVLLSGRGEPDAEPAEDALRSVANRAGMSWTVVRCAWFMQNFSEHLLLEPVRDGTIALPAGAVREPFVDLEDVAEVVVSALTEAGHHGRTYDLTGPELLDFATVARTLTAVVGREIQYLDVTPAAYADAARAAGVPEGEIAPLTELFRRVLDGHNAVLTSDLETLLGRPGGTFAGYARRTADSGVWRSAGPAREASVRA